MSVKSGAMGEAAECIDRGSWSTMKDSEIPIGDIELDVVMKHPETFRALVNECSLSPRTAIAVIARRMDAKRRESSKYWGKLTLQLIALGAVMLALKWVWR